MNPRNVFRSQRRLLRSFGVEGEVGRAALCRIQRRLTYWWARRYYGKGSTFLTRWPS